MEAESYNYNLALLEAAFNRYEASARSIQNGSQFLIERGEVEGKYIKALREWSCKYKVKVMEEDFEPCEEIRNVYMCAVLQAERTTKLHLRNYMNLCHGESPFDKVNKIERTRESRVGRSIDVKKMTADFKKAKALKRSLRDLEAQWTRVRDRYLKEMKKLTESKVAGEVERQAMKESLNAEIEAIKEKLENSKRCLASASRKHELLKEKQTKVFKGMYADLEVVERDRIETTADAFRNLHKILSRAEELDSRSEISSSLFRLNQDIASIAAEDIVSKWSENTRQRVKSKQTRETKSFMSILFDGKICEKRRDHNFGSDIGPRPTSPSFRELASLRYCESLSSRRDPIRVRPGVRQPPVDTLDKEQSLMGAFYTSDSSSESLSRVQPQHLPSVKRVNVSPATDILESTSISSLDNPAKMMSVPQTAAPDAPRTIPTQFCASTEDSSSETFPALVHSEETSPVLSVGETTEDEETLPVLFTAPARVSLTDQILPTQEPQSENGCDVSRLMNVRVRANRDFESTEKGTLSFVRGQVIKQKMPMDNKGNCYGWTRRNRFHPKRYGHYPAEYVSLL